MFVVCSLLNLFLIISRSNVVLSKTYPIVYRADLTSPERLWACEGFTCLGKKTGLKDECMTYQDHVVWPEDLITANKDPWISTSYSKEFAISWARLRYPKVESWVYAISTAGIESKCLDIEEAYRKDGERHPHPNHHEIAIRDEIPWANVVGWFNIMPGKPSVWEDRPSSLSPLKPNDPRKPAITSYQSGTSKHWVETWREDTGPCDQVLNF
ncbi:hypothetical protein PgNI_06545 [Pyricularia grisea]|uniref:Uncharacterized protein n=1 Tax=Pyricularia grisea TaxID=148305 RepID=A0A6P8B6F6_PYRGI|nr:hypothetical protein PgNI_06545 [Pyricularia grisea]TLD10704.1 hypothetical protein PgNI_06545 [Pyricularia grisea]